MLNYSMTFQSRPAEVFGFFSCFGFAAGFDFASYFLGFCSFGFVSWAFGATGFDFGFSALVSTALGSEEISTSPHPPVDF